MDILAANERFGLPGELEIREGRGGFAYAHIENTHAQADLCIYAGQVLSYTPRGARDLLFVSDQAYFAPGKAIKGGIPVCWPWFGPHPDGSSFPDHGFVRTRPWTLLNTGTTANGSTQIRLGCRDDDATRSLWPHAFALHLDVIVGPSLEVALTTRNDSDEPLSITQALHTYFHVGDVRRTRVEGLEGHPFIDKVAGSATAGQRFTEQTPVVFEEAVNRIYPSANRRLTVVDEALERRIVIDRAGSHSVVVWNPWIRQAAEMGDFGDEEYLQMLCVETANAADDAIHIPAGGEHRLVSCLESFGL